MSEENKEIDNLELWGKVDKTNPEYTKAGKKGAFTFTSIAPMYQFKKATEVFGPQGIGWGIEVGTEVFEETDYNGTTIIKYDAVLFYRWHGETGRIPIHASEKVCYTTGGNNAYFKVDDEVRKKVVTNAKTKGLSEVGICADVFLGQFDDPNYIDHRRAEEFVEGSEDRAEAVRHKLEELNEWCKIEISNYPSISNIGVLEKIYAGHKNDLPAKCRLAEVDPAKYIRQFDKAFTNQQDTIKNKVK